MCQVKCVSNKKAAPCMGRNYGDYESRRKMFYKLLQMGALKGFKEGNRYKVSVESVEKYVEMRMRT